MLKNRLDFKLINLAIWVFIFYLIYKTGDLWMGFVSKFINIIAPFLFAFIIAYALHPIVKYLESKRIPRPLSIAIVIISLLGIVTLICVLAFPLLFGQLTNLFNSIILFIKDLSNNLNVDLGTLQSGLSDGFNSVVVSISKYISNGAINVIGVSVGLLSSILICLSSMVYFLIDMDSIRKRFKKFIRVRSMKIFNYIKMIDSEMKNYLIGFLKVVVINLFEYSLAYLIIGHPNALLLGFLASVASLIPYFGGIFVNIIAGITAFVVSPALFIRTLITFIVLSILDGQVINPFIYGKSNKVHPIVTILSVFAGGILFGVVGIIISLPVAIIIVSTFKYYEYEITDKIEVNYSMYSHDNRSLDMSEDEDSITISSDYDLNGCAYILVKGGTIINKGSIKNFISSGAIIYPSVTFDKKNPPSEIYLMDPNPRADTKQWLIYKS